MKGFNNFILYNYCDKDVLIVSFIFSRFDRLLIFGVIGYFLDVDYCNGFLRLEFDVYYFRSDVYNFESICSGFFL